MNGHLESVADANHNTTLGSAIQFGDGQRVHLGCRSKLFGLLKGVLTCATIQHQHHLVGCVGDNLAHHVANLRQLVHQAHLVVQTACGVNQHHIGAICHSAFERVIRNARRVGAHLLANHCCARALGPHCKLVDSRSTEGIGSTDINLLARTHKLCREFTDSGGLARAIDAHNHHHIGLALAHRQTEVLLAFGALLQQSRNLATQDTLQLGGIHIFVTRNALLNALDDAHGGLDTHVRGNQHLFELVQHHVIHLVATCHGTRKFREETLFGLLQSLAELLLLLCLDGHILLFGFLLFAAENIEQSHSFAFVYSPQI